MFLKEALWIAKVIGELPLKSGDIALDIGSSTEKYRCLTQPHIDYYIFRTLRKKGLQITHIDRLRGEGVDIDCDLSGPEMDKSMNEIRPAKLIICTSLLEHVVNRNVVLNRLMKLTQKNGYIILSAPHTFGYHPDPIDTMYRPTNQELENHFSKDEYTIIASEIIKVDEPPPYYEFAKYKRVVYQLTRNLISRFVPGMFDKIRNKVSIIAVQKK